MTEILVGAWKKTGELAQYADSEKYPPEETVLVPMVEHTIVSTHHPKLEPKIRDISLGEIVFDVHLELAIEGVVLRIQGGRIKAITVGSCEASGKVALGEAPILERESGPFALPGTIDLGEGIAVRDPDAG